MRTRPAMIAALALMAALAIPVAGCSGDADTPANGSESLSGESLAKDKCGGSCHGFDRVEPVTKKRSEWKKTVERMEGYGLELTDGERDKIVDYLAENYS